MEPILANLNYIFLGSSRYNIFAIVKKKTLAFNKFFCCSNKFRWDYQSLTQAFNPLYSEDGTNTKRLEVTTYKCFLDFLEMCNFDVMCRGRLWNIFFKIVILQLYSTSPEEICEEFQFLMKLQTVNRQHYKNWTLSYLLLRIPTQKAAWEISKGTFLTNTYFCRIVLGSCICCFLLWLFKFAIVKCFVNIAGVQLVGRETPFFENRQECPYFGKKSPDCSHLGVKFSIQMYFKSI